MNNNFSNSISPLRTRTFFRGGRTSIFSLGLVGIVLLFFLMFACSIVFAQHSTPSASLGGSSETPEDTGSGTASGSDNQQAVEPRQEVQARQGIEPREPLKRP